MNVLFFVKNFTRLMAKPMLMTSTDAEIFK